MKKDEAAANTDRFYRSNERKKENEKWKKKPYVKSWNKLIKGYG